MTSFVIDGETWHEYIVDYRFEGKDYSITIAARSEQEVRARLTVLPMARIEGILDQRIPAAIPGAGLWVRFSCWWNNLTRKMPE